MSFLNGALAFGAAALTIPLIIHLFFRSRFKTVDWGAMHLLENVIRVNRRRMQLTNLLLLLLRCAIPVLLAMCLARPVLTGFQALAGDTPKTLVVALDDSLSMSVTPPGGTSRLDQAKEHLRTILGDLTRRDEVILVRSSRLGAVPAKMGISDALASIRKVAAEGGPLALGQLLDAATQAAETGSHARRQILLVSDFQNNTVGNSTMETARRLASSIEAESASTSLPVIDFLNVGGESDSLSNVSIDSVSIDSPVVVSKRAGVYSATLRNSGELPANDLRLVWSIDGQPLDPRVVSIDPKATATNRLTHVIDDPGTHEIALAISRSDVLPNDNRRSVAVEVMREVNVVLIDGKPSREPLAGQADFLAIALSPFAFGGDDRPDPVRAAVVREQKLDEALSESDVRVVILAGVSRVSQKTQQALADFVSSGGALVVFDGSTVKPSLYNQPWKGTDFELRFPAWLNDNIVESKDESGLRIEKPTQAYQPWRILSRGDDNPFSDVGVQRHRSWKIDLANENSDNSDPKTDPPEAEPANESEVMVLLKTMEGVPLAVAAKANKGTVVQFAFSGNDDWSNLPLRPVFLPLIQQMVLDLSGRRRDAMIQVGEPIVLTDDDWPVFEKKFDDRSITSYLAETPDGKTELDAPAEKEPLRITSTYASGLYRITKRTRDRDDADHAETAQVLRIASIPSAESNLVDVDPKRLDSLAGTLGATVFSSASSLQTAERNRSFGREIWRWLLALLLLAMVAELWLQQNLAGKRLTGTKP